MILPTKKDLGRRVSYRHYRAIGLLVVGETVKGRLCEIDKMTVGVIFNDHAIPRIQNRVDLEWARDAIP